MSELINGVKDIIKIGEDVFVPLLTEEQIQARIKELAAEISRDYKGKVPVFIGVLNGSFIFMSDLIKSVELDCEIDFFKLSSYGDAKISSGKVTMLKELNCDVTDRDIIIVEDIVDSGLSVKYIEDLFSESKPKSMKLVTLLTKPNSVKYDVKIDYIGFNIPSKFVIGYGLDYAQKYRNLRSIYVLDDDKGI
ncbi:hypoxanthine phosphoribosyltransferase [bacterium BMS3Abin03]|nr:hypoxanthine phosphoribosyltransferase [bacterium BMS3Abin03]MCG6960494.1 hypoxanthine phosphoribosyltransferase [bacterium BMS3Abin03]